ncbi:hypothetical protein G6F68_015698 [Rhizopus microsporus]|nr:hypothetical protein G6F32_017370 [Rhizopus arrhizus]KAG1243801.1 hypothetical protein G6F68_015698 [Rhizopus microsporus]
MRRHFLPVRYRRAVGCGLPGRAGLGAHADGIGTACPPAAAAGFRYPGALRVRDLAWPQHQPGHAHHAGTLLSGHSGSGGGVSPACVSPSPSGPGIRSGPFP